MYAYLTWTNISILFSNNKSIRNN